MRYFNYLRNPGFQNVIDAGGARRRDAGRRNGRGRAFFGSVVSYSLLRREGQSLGWKVPLYVTLGAPLAVTVIKGSLAPIKHPQRAARLFNAKDDRDVVALYPLDSRHFPVTPAIENKTDVRNHTSNGHGISGYLSDSVVAKRIYDALVI